MNGVTFNGQHSSSINGLTYITSSRFIIPENKDTYVDVPGRDGALLIPDSSKKDIEIPVQFTLEGNNVANLFAKFLQVSNWLETEERAQLKFDDLPGYYWNAKAYASIPLEQIENFEEVAEFTVLFRCEPYPKVVGS